MLERNLRFSSVFVLLFVFLFVTQDYSLSYLFHNNAESNTLVVALIFRLLLTFICRSYDFIKKSDHAE